MIGERKRGEGGREGGRKGRREEKRGNGAWIRGVVKLVSCSRESEFLGRAS
jgi:hypothetical protein